MIARFPLAACAALLSGCLGGGECIPFTSQAVDETNNNAWSLSGSKSQGIAIQFTGETSAYSIGPVYQDGVRNSDISFLLGSSLRKSTDGGLTWKSVNETLADVYFLNANTGWAVGGEGAILSTSDGGRTWTSRKSGTKSNLASVYFTSALAGIAVGADGVILKTSDGGAVWKHRESGTDENLTSVHFATATDGYAIGDGVILRTFNGGQTWSKQIVGQERNYFLASVHFADAQRGWIAGEGWDHDRVLTYKTVNGGKSWVEQNGFMDADMSLTGIVAIQFASAQTGWVLGAAQNSSGRGYVLLKTVDGGLNWSESKFIVIPGSDGGETRVASFYFLGTELGWLAVGESYFATQDGGRTWTAAGSGLSAPMASQHFLNPGLGYAVGMDGTFFRTENGGVSWTVQRGGLPSGASSFFFLDSNTGWTTGEAGALSKTTDGGGLWLPQTSGTTRRLLSIHFVNAQTGYAAGENGALVKTTNGGTLWTPLSSGTTSTLRAVRFADAQTGYAAGDAGVLLRTLDGGATWIAQASGTNKNLASIALSEGDKVVVAGGGVGDPDTAFTSYKNPRWSHGVLLRSGDGGATWAQQDTTVTPLKLYSVAFAGGGVGYAVGGGPTYVSYPDNLKLLDDYCTNEFTPGYFTQILKTTDGGITWKAEQTIRQKVIRGPEVLTAGDPFLSISCSSSGACAALGMTEIVVRPK